MLETTMKKSVTVLVPAYNEEENLQLFYSEVTAITDALEGFAFRFLFINDGSTDGTLACLKSMAAEHANVQYLSFSRNFGKESAIYAGLQHAEGDYVILMDADLQHPPALIPQMLEAVESGAYQAAAAKRKSNLSSRMFTGVHNKVSDVKIQKGATDYMCMSRQFVEAVLSLSERQRFSKGLFAWVGFSIKWFDYEQEPRRHGTSKWRLGKLFSYAADGLTSFSIFPLHLVTWAGVIICFLAIIYIIATLIKTLVTGIETPGYVTTLCAILFLGGVMMLSLGILGAYIGRIYLESKERPMYILQESCMQNPEEEDAKTTPTPERDLQDSEQTNQQNKVAPEEHT